ncbi:MAG: hypothetical protein PHN88_02965 [Ignavibacteria bacterium]|nr:hypothetical protein [Ignavibacteria bacterium]
MKKPLFPVLFLSGLLIFFLYSCKSEKPETNKNENSTAQTNKDITASKEEIKTHGDIKLSDEEQKKLNVFFSNFSEVNLESFTSENIKDETLIDFGILHIYKNSRNKFEKIDNSNSKIKSDFVNEAVFQYFGKNIKSHKSTGTFKFKNGYYYLPVADGEAFIFSQVARMTDLGKDFFSAEVNVYSTGSGWTGNVHSNPKDWGKNGEEAPALSGKFRAKIQRDTDSSGNVRYILIDYIKQ